MSEDDEQLSRGTPDFSELGRRTSLAQRIASPARRVNTQARMPLDDRYHPFSNSPPMRRLDEMMDRVAAKDVTVLVWGESGVGKELVARTLHQRSRRDGQPFVKVNCAALPALLLESELFGYERGAFTGAERRNRGKFEQAHKGTIFLDEVSEASFSLQAKLLHVLQDRRFARLGSEEDVCVDVRIIAATNRDLRQYVADGGFRKDLFYRLNVINLRVPPLRERIEEVDILVDHFLRVYSQKHGRRATPVSPAMLEQFRRYSWPGNVRQLQNIVQRIVLLGTEAIGSGLEDLETQGSAKSPNNVEENKSCAEREWTDDRLGLKELTSRAVAHVERMALTRTLERAQWRRVEAARRLQISYKTLLNKIKHYQLDRADS